MALTDLAILAVILALSLTAAATLAILVYLVATRPDFDKSYELVTNKPDVRQFIISAKDASSPEEAFNHPLIPPLYDPHPPSDLPIELIEIKGEEQEDGSWKVTATYGFSE